jgi:hypothetical protein
MVPKQIRFLSFREFKSDLTPMRLRDIRRLNDSVRKFASFGTIRAQPTTHARYGNIEGRDQDLTLQAVSACPAFRQTSNLEQSGIMKNIILLSFSLTLVACSSGLPELKYADGSARIPVNPKPIPLTNPSQSTAITQADKPGDVPVPAATDTAKPAAKHGCRRPQEKEKAIGFEGFKGFDMAQYADPQNQLISFH